jgi:(p)ppGpp synthase/HD superfamily hydrolase
VTAVTKGIHNDDHPPAAAVWWQRASNEFAGLRIAQAAIAFATVRHAGQQREIDDAPFITHPIEVAGLLRRDGQPDEIIAAGILHDILEKTATTSAELQRRFGPQITRLVESVSETIQHLAITPPVNATYATASRTQSRARVRCLQRTRSRRLASWRCCRHGS